MKSIDNRVKRERSFFESLKIKHLYSIRSGLYKFILKNTIKLILVLLAILAGIFLLNWLFDLESLIERFIFSLKFEIVFIVFLINESVLGWIPPDLFIVWAKQFTNQYLWVSILGLISYLGGINAYFIGRLLLRFPAINNYIHRKNEKYFKMIRKWGGTIILLSAIFPLPFATISTIAGMMNYPFKQFLLYGTIRFFRFYLHAFIIFNALDTFI